MNMMKKDPDTGEIKINGKFGALLSLLDQLAPIMRALVVAALLASIPWVIRIEKHLDHEDPRALFIDEVPPEEVTKRLDTLEVADGENTKLLYGMKGQLEIAVAKILEDDDQMGRVRHEVAPLGSSGRRLGRWPCLRPGDCPVTDDLRLPEARRSH